MKYLILILSLVINPAWAIDESEGPGDPVEPKPYQLEVIKYQTTILLDKRTFSGRDVERLDLDRVLRADNRLTVGYRTEETREGTVLLIITHGKAWDTLALFNSLLNFSVNSFVINKGGFAWNLPSEAYLDFLSSRLTAVKKEIETQAFLQWAGKPENLKSEGFCQLALDINRFYVPPTGKFQLTTPGENKN